MLATLENQIVCQKTDLPNGPHPASQLMANLPTLHSNPLVVYTNTGIKAWRGIPLNDNSKNIMATIERCRTEARTQGFSFNCYTELDGRCSAIGLAQSTPQPYSHQAEIYKFENQQPENPSNTTFHQDECRRLHWPGAEPWSNGSFNLQPEEEYLFEGADMTEFPFHKDLILFKFGASKESLHEITKSFALPYNLIETFAGAESYLAITHPEPEFFHAFKEWEEAQKRETQLTFVAARTVNMADVYLRAPPVVHCTDQSLRTSQLADLIEAATTTQRSDQAGLCSTPRKRKASESPTSARKHHQ